METNRITAIMSVLVVSSLAVCTPATTGTAGGSGRDHRRTTAGVEVSGSITIDGSSTVFPHRGYH